MRALTTLVLAALVVAGQAACAPKPAAFTVAVTDDSDGHFTAAQYYSSQGCTGNNISPRLIWTEPPAGTRSLAVTIFDPDAKTDHGGWWHWLVADLPPDSRELKAGAGAGLDLPSGAVQYNNDFSQPGYGGPCPPVGETHTYVVTLYALKTAHLTVPAGASDNDIRTVLDAAALSKATTTLSAGR